MAMTSDEKKARRKEYYQKNRDKILARVAKYRKEHKDELREKSLVRSRIYYSEHRDECNARSRKWQKDHGDETALRRSTYMKQWKENNADHVKEYMEKYRADNEESLKDWRKKYNCLNFDEISRRAKMYRENNPDKMTARNVNYRKNNYESEIDRIRKYHHEHPEKLRCHANKRRATKLGASGRGISDTDEAVLKDEYAHMCVYCGRKDVSLTVDHIVPLSRGGDHDIENATVCCKSCNSKKKNNSLLRFMYRKHVEETQNDR